MCSGHSSPSQRRTHSYSERSRTWRADAEQRDPLRARADADEPDEEVLRRDRAAAEALGLLARERDHSPCVGGHEDPACARPLFDERAVALVRRLLRPAERAPDPRPRPALAERVLDLELLQLEVISD
jgi:hypothetical protein